jgi:hypothetical protein
MPPRYTLKQKGEQKVDPVVVGLAALSWIVTDPARADRMLALTGLTADDLRARADEPPVLGAVIGFLEAHEPDLLACAEAIGVEPSLFGTAREELER